MKILKEDHHSVIGFDHIEGGKPCQDYALSGNFGDVHYAIVSDGCSGGRATEMGSSVLASATKQAIASLAKRPELTQTIQSASQFMQTQQLNTLQIAMPLLGLGFKDMVATCCSVVMTPTCTFALMQGDGVLVYKTKTGERVVVIPHWNDKPYYPAYHLFPAAMSNFLNETTGMVLTTKAVTTTTEKYTPEKGMDFLVDLTPILSELVSVSVFTDGVQRISDNKTSTLSVDEVLEELLRYPAGMQGPFLVRRHLKILKLWQEKGLLPRDDLSGATILIEEMPDGNQRQA